MPGIHTPYVYIGSPLTSFAFHLEDGNLYSINYLHHGQPKVWYIVPGKEGKKLEKLIERIYTDCPLSIRHKTTMVPPSILKKNGIKFSRIIQYPGEYIVLFPDTYHSGFNCGLNVAEAINFARPSWLKFFPSFRICDRDCE